MFTLAKGEPPSTLTSLPTSLQQDGEEKWLILERPPQDEPIDGTSTEQQRVQVCPWLVLLCLPPPPHQVRGNLLRRVWGRTVYADHDLSLYSVNNISAVHVLQNLTTCY